jgi:outer membrane lipoprotein carrier protein
MFKKMKLLKSAAVIATLFTSVLTSNTAIADSTEPTSEINANAVTQESDASKAKLMAKLAKIEFFSAEFSQKIFDETGNELQQGSGLLSVSKPNLVNWQTTLPDESLIVSDGSNLWFYDPFVEQVSVYSLANAIANTPILLITSNDEKLWRDYNVSQLADNRYLISANNDNARVKSLELTFAEDINNVELSAFNILDATGQLSVITLSNHNEKPDTSLFTFTVPEGVYLDDQR